MAKERVCPGCSRHCPMSNLRCKYGQKYFQKRERIENRLSVEKSTDDAVKRRKWEEYVEEGGTGWKLLSAASRSKKALRRKKLTEKELLAPLDEAQRKQLDELLGRILDVF